MPIVTVAVIAVALAAGAVVTLASLWRHGRPADEAEQAVVRGILSRESLRRFVARRLDRTAAGGFLLTLAIGAVVAAFVIVGAVFDMVDSEAGLANWDSAAAEWGAANASLASHQVIHFITDLGGTTGVVVVTIALSLFYALRERTWRVPAFLITVAVSQSLVNNAVKWIVSRPRPDIAQFAGWAGSSFPSGHTAAAAAVWAAVAFVLGRNASNRTRALLSGAAAVVAIAVAASRVLLGVHWLTDVIAGLAMGWGVFLIVAIVFGGRQLRFGRPAEEVEQLAPVVEMEEARHAA